MSKTKVCVVGLGHWGPNLVRAIQSHPDAEVTVAAEASAERREFVREKINDVPIVSTLDECLADYPVDAVVIAVPTEHHFRVAMQALNAGKHVLVEKPLAHSISACQQLTEKASQERLVLMTGHVFLFNNGVNKTKEIIDSGELGTILYIHSIRTNLGPIRSDVNALWDLASHDISIFNYLFDESPMEVTCAAYPLLGRSVEDIAQGSLKYSGGRVAAFFVSWLDPQKKREITVVGDRKMLTFDDMNPEIPLRVYDKGIKVSQPTEYADTFKSFRMSVREGNVHQPKVTTGEPLKSECHHFVDCVRKGTVPVSDGDFGLGIVGVLEGLSKSVSQNGAPVSLWRRNAPLVGNLR